MARMFELGLIEKEKDGVKVSYNISRQGRIFLEKMNRGVDNG
jgi:predicted transcriptional regulator